MEVQIAHPFLYVSGSGLWPGIPVNIYGVAAPISGQPTPTYHLLKQLAAPGDVVTVQLPVAGNHFAYAALAFAVVAAPGNIGKVTLQISRDEDPLTQTGERPVYQTIELERANGQSPTFVIHAYQLVGT